MRPALHYWICFVEIVIVLAAVLVVIALAGGTVWLFVTYPAHLTLIVVSGLAIWLVRRKK